jgi:Endonuclease NucS C-terminal domain
VKLTLATVTEVKGLEPLVVKHIQDIEEKMCVLDHQLSFSQTDRPDILAVDEEGALCILELKISTADLKVLSQILRYLEWASLNVALIARAFPKVKPDASVRLFIVAPEFSQDLQRVVKYMEPELALIRASCVSGNDSSDLGVLLQKVDIERPQPTRPMRGVEDIVGFISEPQVKKTFEKIRSDLNKLGVEIRPYKGGKDRWLECMYKGSEIGYFKPLQKSVRCTYYEKDEEIKPRLRIKTYKDWGNKLRKYFVRSIEDMDKAAE